VNACLVIEVPEYSESRGVSNVTAVEVDVKPKAKAKKRKSEDSEDSQKQPNKKKKDKKAKDPNAPKRNISAYMHYAKDTRDNVKASQPGLTFGDISKVVSTNWKALSDQERAIWDEKAAADKVRYQKDLAEYEATEATAEDIVAKMLADDEK
jgi:hypothetical protein